MPATASGPTRAWAATHRMLLAVVAVAVVATVALAIVLLTSSGTSAGDTSGPSTDGSSSGSEVLQGQTVPRDEDVLSPTERACQLARVAGC